jgi:AcrR family transcriptional regulator
MTAAPTRERLLDSAERRFAENGFDGASLRTITAEARANLAAVHYHFGSKEDLFLAVLERRLDPINRERIERLGRAEAESGGRPVPVETLVAILIEPVLRRGGDPRAGGPSFLKLFGRVQSDSGTIWKRIVDGPMRPVRERMFAALRRALPELSEPELTLRMHFAIGAVKGVAGDQHRLRALSGGRVDPDDLETTCSELVRFLAAGLRAPAASARARPARAARKAKA